VTTSVLWIIFGGKLFLNFVIYSLVYPFIIVYRVCRLLFGRLEKIIFFSPLIFGLVFDFKKKFIMTTVLLAALVVIFSVDKNSQSGRFELYSLTGCVITLQLILIYFLGDKFITSMNSSVLTRVVKSIAEFKEKIQDDQYFGQYMLRIDKSNNMTENHGDPLPVYMFYSLAEILNSKIRDVFTGGGVYYYLIINWVYILLFTVLIYSVEYFALFKINPASFSVDEATGYLSFVGFSFSRSVSSGISQIAPIDDYARLICYSEDACYFFIVFILFYSFFTVAHKKVGDDIDLMTKNLSEAMIILEESTQRHLKLKLCELENKLAAKNRPLINWSRKVRGLPELSQETDRDPIEEIDLHDEVNMNSLIRSD